ncbi:NHL repeat-containing protein [candidate division KSB1 bacterium]|nr:NHL repeat-containing protein [candidate division KSB1 bacterium]
MKMHFFVILLFVAIAPLLPSERKLNATFLFAFGEKGEQPAQFNRPLGVSADAKGNVYVSDSGNNRLQKFTPQGELIAFIGGFGWEKEQFQFPIDIFVYNSLDIFVADFDNNRIERYDKDLNWLTSYYSNDNWSAKMRFLFPISVCVSLHGDFFIVDSENDRVIKLNASFEPELSFGDYDWGAGVLQEASHIYVSKNDVIYVTDPGAHKILVYDYYGNFLYDVGVGELVTPKGLCVDDQEQIFVADASKNQVLTFDKNGRLLLTIGSLSSKFAGFNEPSDVTIIRDKLYVADTQNHRIQIFQLAWEN